ncbi:MAG: zinc-dependent metalloprotease [Micrococcales bacterium]
MTEPGDIPESGDEFEEFMARFLAEVEADPKLAEMVKQMGLPKDPVAMRQAMDQVRNLIARQNKDGSAGWDLAIAQARSQASKHSEPIDDTTRTAIAAAMQLAPLWLGGATAIAPPATDPKLLSRELWVQDAFPLIRELAKSVADRMGAALSEALPNQDVASASETQMAGMLGWLGSTLVAMQLAEAIAALSKEVIGGGDIGLPIFEEQRPAFVAQNLREFANELDTETDQVYIFMVVRELAHTGLFKHARWLRDHVIQQIQKYAHDIHIHEERVRELAENFDSSNPSEVQAAIKNGDLLAERNEDQMRALEAIETMLALIEGWVDAVTAEATKLLPKSLAIQEAVRRRRATGGAAEKTFGTLIGLELRPRKLREASKVWQQLTERYGAAKRDELWAHPDLLPTALELANVDQLFARLDDNGDEFDRDLRKLLDE